MVIPHTKKAQKSLNEVQKSRPNSKNKPESNFFEKKYPPVQITSFHPGTRVKTGN
jgi:hypothetical protein